MNPNDERSIIINKSGEISEIPVSMQLYQAIYNDITGRTEKISDTYEKYYELSIDSLFQLNSLLKQFCEQYQVKGFNSSITVFHVKGSKEVFSSFERLNTYNISNSKPIERIYIVVNTLLVLPKVRKPQNYQITIDIISGMALVDKHQDSLPSHIPLDLVMRAIQKDTLEVDIEYVDYIVARSMSELVREWVDSLPEIKTNSSLFWWQSKSHVVRSFVALLFLIMAVFFSSKYAEILFSHTSEPYMDLANFLLYAFLVVQVANFFGNFLGRCIERAIDSCYSDSFSKIVINMGDKKLKEKHQKKISSSKVSILLNTVWTLALGVGASLIAAYIIS